MLSDGTKADYVLGDRHGRALAVVEAKRRAIDPLGAEKQARGYAIQLGVPFVFLANGKSIWFWEFEQETHPHEVRTFFSQADLERRAAARAARKDLMQVRTDTRIADRPYQEDCIDTLCKEITGGRRKLLVEMATGTGKTRTAAALINRLFGAGSVTRVLFLVDRIPLGKQTEDAFAQYLPNLPAYVLRAGRRFQDEKRITITTLQSMVNEYAKYSSGYFDLVISDECHRSIYGKWSGVLKHFDGIQVGLTATPCVASPDVLAALDDQEDSAFVRDTLRFFELDKPTYRYTLKQGIQEGFLVPYRIYKALTVKTAAASGFPVRRDELDWSAIDPETTAELEAMFAHGDPITIDPNALERRFTIPERNRAIVREFRDVLLNGYGGKDGVRRFPYDGKTIVFAVTKRHAATLAQMLDTEFADRKPDPAIRYADFVVSAMDRPGEGSADALAKITRFKKEPFPRILVSVNMLDTGFDCPEVAGFLEGMSLPLPPLVEQRRIVDILDRAASIRRLRRQAQETARQIVPALFNKMFGDPGTNLMRWPIRLLGTVPCEPPRNGLSPSQAGTDSDSVLTLSAITSGSFDATAVKDAKFARPVAQRERVSRLDFLVTRGNGNLDLVGRGEFPQCDMPNVAFPGTMIAVRPNRQELLPDYLSALWKTAYVRRYLAAKAQTANGTFKLNQTAIASVPVLVPPLAACRTRCSR